jgi:uncharacterized membrane protein
LKKYFITGLLIWIPLAITFMVLAWIVGTLDADPAVAAGRQYQPSRYSASTSPASAWSSSLLLMFFTGLVAANVSARSWSALGGLLARIPVVKSIYYSVKQVSDTLFSSSGQAFRKALLVQYPREGMWTIAFQTGSRAVTPPTTCAATTSACMCRPRPTRPRASS